MDYVELDGVCKYYHMGENTVAAADGVSFSLEKGSFGVIIGPSGAGKTTVLNILGGMDVCDGGKVILDGRNISALTQKELTAYRRYDVGFVFQFYNLIQNLTARENVDLAGDICNSPAPAAEMLRLVGLEERMNNFPSQLSGGEMQRVAIARAMVKRPKILLCDEPTGALDYSTGKAVLKLLRDTGRETGTTVIVVTHNQAIAPMADQVIRMNSGKVVSSERNRDPVPVESIEW